MSHTPPESPRPIPLWAGVYFALVMALVFLGIYGDAGDTTARGWFATVAFVAELCGVVMIASPELRPRVVGFMRWVSGKGRRILARWWAWLRRLLHIPAHRTVIAPAGVALAGGLGGAVVLSFEQPPETALIQDKVAYLLEQDKRWHQQFEFVRNETTQRVDMLRAELRGTATELRKHAEEAVTELANKELNMRLLEA